MTDSTILSYPLCFLPVFFHQSCCCVSCHCVHRRSLSYCAFLCLGNLSNVPWTLFFYFVYYRDNLPSLLPSCQSAGSVLFLPQLWLSSYSLTTKRDCTLSPDELDSIFDLSLFPSLPFCSVFASQLFLRTLSRRRNHKNTVATVLLWSWLLS